MKQIRKRIVIGVMVPVVMALIILKRTMHMPSMNGVAMVNIEALLLTGMLLGIAIAQSISVFRKPTETEHVSAPEQIKQPLAS